MELKERSSRSLLANVLDMDDDFRSASGISYAPTYNSNLTNRYSSGGVGTGLGGSGGGGVGPGNSSTLPHFPTSASYHQQQASVGQQQSTVHLVESSLIHGNMISANAQSSTFGSRAGGFAVDEDSPSTPYCLQVRLILAVNTTVKWVSRKKIKIKIWAVEIEDPFGKSQSRLRKICLSHAKYTNGNTCRNSLDIDFQSSVG